ncbi:MAG TPA: hypothetical protein DCX95_01255 [Elusimicrobia bacterium]|nr:hypothetical protein [Elusimicrobiota bacterium]
MQKNKILFFTPGVNAPASRFRVLQYIKYLKQAGFIPTVKPTVPDKDFSPRQLFPKLYNFNKWLARVISLFLYLYMLLNRMFDVLASIRYDIVFLQRDLYSIRQPMLEKLLSILNKNIIFDFDDAIFLQNRKKIARIIQLSKHVIVGNSYLEKFAKTFTNNVTVIPTVIDTSKYHLRHENTSEQVIIGYVGSSSTLNYLSNIKNCLLYLTKKYNNIQIRILSIFTGTKFTFIENSVYIEWTPENEISEISRFDIGLMPLDDNEWTRGKCGAKILQYMAGGIPTVASPVGVNSEIIQDGFNGFLASTDEIWIKKLSILIENRELRKQMGIAGRKTVEEKYSVEVNFPKLIEVLKKVENKVK